MTIFLMREWWLDMPSGAAGEAAENGANRIFSWIERFSFSLNGRSIARRDSRTASTPFRTSIGAAAFSAMK
jgi:hypothetical protein